MIKSADVASMLDGLKDKAQSTLSGVGDSVSSWYGAQPESVRKALAYGLIGAGTGAALSGGYAAMKKRDPDESATSAVISPALMGALFGGVAGSGIALGKGVLSNDVSLPGLPKPPDRPFLTRVTDPMVNLAGENYGPLLGGLAPFLHKGTRKEYVRFIDDIAEGRTSGLGRLDALRAAFRKAGPRQVADLKDGIPLASTAGGLKGQVKTRFVPGRRGFLLKSLLGAGAGYVGQRVLGGEY